MDENWIINGVWVQSAVWFQDVSRITYEAAVWGGFGILILSPTSDNSKSYDEVCGDIENWENQYLN